ncbi:uncharacterized protein LOC110712330 [Chenopodium quinoa]|uniref:uncharacterized protein LOC110712330 n=1 Tax=Chenopodium quinoa TaxID=63459 RepID=UPI000B76DB01|nr:uncharacterized protein LOC110712330 [Chenopodium quinoa]
MVEVLEESSITEKEQVNCVGSQRAWFSDILAYKLHGSLPDDEVQAKKVKKDANWYVVMNGELNKKGFSKPLLSCILEWEQEGIMEEAHSGICANHIGGKALGVEVLRRGAYWPTLTFGVPQCIAFDHGCQFDCDTIKDYLGDLGTKYASASVCHPQSNGQAEAANKLILTALQKKLEEYKGLWADLVPEVLWANRTTKKESTGKSPFTLAYGVDAVVLA